MRKSESCCRLELTFPTASAPAFIAALTSEVMLMDDSTVTLETDSIRDLRARWNTVMRAVHAVDDVLAVMQGCSD